MTSRDAYIVGKTGSFHVPTLAEVDTAITRLTRQIEHATPKHRQRLWDDVDTLLERRSALTAGRAVTA